MQKTPVALIPHSTGVPIIEEGSTMSDHTTQPYLFADATPAAAWEADAARRALDELFSLTRQYKSGDAYRELLQFIGRFRAYSPYNAMLVQIQMPGARYVASPHRWLRDYGRHIRPGARPLVILQPMGPVMFVFDVSDTEPGPSARRLPREIENPFEVRSGAIQGQYEQTIENAVRDGIQIVERDAGSQSAGAIRTAEGRRRLQFRVKSLPQLEYVEVPVRYDLFLNMKHSREAKFATIVHELGHLYCGHLGTPNEKWWADRRGLTHEVCEFEAESICYLVCARLGIDNSSDEYLSGYLDKHREVPSISLECVMKSAGLIEQMGRERLKPRKERNS